MSGLNCEERLKKEIEKREKSEKILDVMKSFLFDYFHKLGPDPMKNIDIIVETACKALNSAVALYNRLEEDGVLKTWSIYNEPPDYKREDKPDGHICYDMTIKKRSPDNLVPVVLENLEGTVWEKLDSNVEKYGIKAYLAFPVVLENKVVGSLCIVDLEKRVYSDVEKNILEAFAKGVTLEEERRLAQNRLALTNRELKDKNSELQEALSNIKTLRGMLPICASCKKVRDDTGYWDQIESYIGKNSEADFSHAICPDCAKKLYGDYLDDGVQDVIKE